MLQIGEPLIALANTGTGSHRINRAVLNFRHLNMNPINYELNYQTPLYSLSLLKS